MSSTARPAKSFATASITRAAAIALVEAARGAAEAMGINVATAVTDAGGHLRAFERADRTLFLTCDVAIDKAWTAASYGVATHTWNGYLADPQVTLLANVPRLMPVGGGNPINDGDQVIGALACQAALTSRTGTSPKRHCGRLGLRWMHDPDTASWPI